MRISFSSCPTRHRCVVFAEAVRLPAGSLQLRGSALASLLSLQPPLGSTGTAFVAVVVASSQGSVGFAFAAGDVTDAAGNRLVAASLAVADAVVVQYGNRTLRTIREVDCRAFYAFLAF